MLEAIRERREQKGFTLVELIVVLVILAILAAMLVPTMTGYIDRANQDKLVAETRMIVMAAQTIASEQYGAGDAGETINTMHSSSDGADSIYQEIKELAETKEDFQVTITDNQVDNVTYPETGDVRCVYEGATGEYTIKKEAP